jgi:multidrug resistance efflux pump
MNDPLRRLKRSSRPGRIRVAAGAGALGAAALALAGAAVSAPGSATVELTANGTVQALRTAYAGFATGGRLAALYVHEGERVSAGQVLARLSDADARRRVGSGAVDLAAARARLAELLAKRSRPLTPRQRRESAAAEAREAASVAAARTALADARAAARSDVAALELALSQASAKHVAAQQESQALQQQLETAVAAAKAAADAAAARLEATRRDATSWRSRRLALLKEQEDLRGSADPAAEARLTEIAKTLLDVGETLERLQEAASDQAAAAGAAKSDHAAAIAKLESARESTRSQLASLAEAAATARSNVESGKARAAQTVHGAEAALRAAIASQRVTRTANEAKATEVSESELASARATVASAERALADARQAFEQTVLRSPVTGVVGSLSGAVGDTVGGGGSSGGGSSGADGSGASGGAFATILADGLEVKALFSEVDSVAVEPGQEAVVEITALGESVTGRVVAVSAVPTTVDGKTLYAARIRLDRVPQGLKAGMGVRVEVAAEL